MPLLIHPMLSIKISFKRPSKKQELTISDCGVNAWARSVADHQSLVHSNQVQHLAVLSKATSPSPAKRFITCPAKNIMIKQSLTHHAAKNGFARSKMPKAQVGENPRFKLILIYACKNYFCRCCWSECGSYNCRSK